MASPGISRAPGIQGFKDSGIRGFGDSGESLNDGGEDREAIGWYRSMTSGGHRPWGGNGGGGWEGEGSPCKRPALPSLHIAGYPSSFRRAFRGDNRHPEKPGSRNHASVRSGRPVPDQVLNFPTSLLRRVASARSSSALVLTWALLPEIFPEAAFTSAISRVISPTTPLLSRMFSLAS